MTEINPYVLAPELTPTVRRRIDYTQPSFGEACEQYREAKRNGTSVPENVMSVIAIHAANNDDPDLTFYELDRSVEGDI